MPLRQIKIAKSITNRETRSLEKYLQEISKEELITPEEEVELARRVKEGDMEALHKLVRANLRFVISVAKQYQNQGLPLEDLINEGNLGLIKAAQRFDETRGFKFISYAVWWIRQSILQALAENARLIRLPLNKVGSLNKINRALHQLEQEYEREPTPEEMAELLNIPISEVEKTIRYAAKHASLDTPIQEEEQTTLKDIVPDPKSMEEEQERDHREALSIEVENLLDILSEQERQIVKMRYGIGSGFPMSFEDIARRLNMTRERVRQVHDVAIRKLRSSKRAKALQAYL